MAKQISDCEYNVHKQMVKRLQFLHHAERYVKESEKEGHSQCAAMWKKMIEEERKQVNELQEALKRDSGN
jgi:hypothetical protein